MSVKIKENGKENGLKMVGEPHFFELARNGPIWLIGGRGRHGQVWARGSQGSRGALCGVVVRPAIIVALRWLGVAGCGWMWLEVAQARGKADQTDELSHLTRGHLGKILPGTGA